MLHIIIGNDMRIQQIYRLILVVFVSLFTNTLYAQESKDSIRDVRDIGKVEISKEELQKLWKDQELLKEKSEQLKNLIGLLSTKQHLADSLSRLVNNLSKEFQKRDKDYDRLQKEFENLKEKSIAADKHLIDMAANFLFIPYEQYSIEKIAIPAFSFVQSQDLKQEYGDRLKFLRSYQQDLRDLADFLKLPGIGRTKISAGSALDKLKALSVYREYHEYDWLNESFLHSKMNDIEKRLNRVFQTGSPIEFSDITNELQRCINTIMPQ